MSDDALVPRPSPAVLLVDDQEAVRNVLRLVLLRGGYTVLAAPDAAEASALSRGHPGTIDLLITDVNLPQTSGRLLAGRLCAERPGLRVLYISGIEEACPPEATGAPAGFLKKPFNAAQLLAAVGEILARPA